MRPNDEKELVTLANGHSYQDQVSLFVLKNKSQSAREAQFRMMRDFNKGERENG